MEIKGNFVGWGCRCFDKNGKPLKEPTFDKWKSMEEMVKRAYQSEHVHSLQIYETYQGWEEKRPSPPTEE